jgi:hypothetical protein
MLGILAPEAGNMPYVSMNRERGEKIKSLNALEKINL